MCGSGKSFRLYCTVKAALNVTAYTFISGYRHIVSATQWHCAIEQCLKDGKKMPFAFAKGIFFKFAVFKANWFYAAAEPFSSSEAFASS